MHNAGKQCTIVPLIMYEKALKCSFVYLLSPLLYSNVGRANSRLIGADNKRGN